MKITILMLFTKMREVFPSLKIRIPKQFLELPLNGIRLYSEEIIPEEVHYLYICDPHVPEVDVHLASHDPVLFISENLPAGLNKKVIPIRGSFGTAEIFNTLQHVWDEFLDWDRSIHERMLQDPSFDNLLQAASSMFRDTVLIYDRGLKLLAHSHFHISTDNALQKSIESGFLLPEVAQEFSQEHVFNPENMTEPTLQLPEGRLPTLYQPFLSDGKITGFCVMLLHDLALKDYSRQLFSNFYLSASICMQNYLTNRNTSGMMEEYVIIHLLENEDLDEVQIQRRMEHLTIPYESEFYLLLIPFPDDMESVRQYLSDRCQSSISNSLTLEYKESLLILIYGEQRIDCLHYKEQLPIVLLGLLSELQPYSLNCMVSLPFRYITQIRYAYGQTQDLLFLGHKGSLSKKAILFFDDFVLTYFKFNLPGVNGMNITAPVLEIIEREEGPKYPMLQELLRTFLSCSCNISNTAKLLHMHRNNVIYHIRRLEEKYNINFQDMEQIVRLYIALF